MEHIKSKVGEVLQQMVESKANYELLPKEGDYVVDGIKHCGVCKEPKEFWCETGSKPMLCPIPCKCRRDEMERERLQKKKKKKVDKIRYLRNRSMMDEEFAGATFQRFDVRADNEKQYKACLKYVKRFDEMLKESQGLLFYGEVGTGKSFAAGCIANALLENTQSVIMTSFVKILQSLSSNFGNKRDDESALMRDLMQPELLILDDLGAERSTDYAVEKVFNIIDSRCRERKPMILTTNLTLSDMKQCTDIRYARIYDRVFSACYPIKFEGVSRRKIEAKKRFEKMKKFFEGDD